MRQGRIVEQGPAEKILHRPSHPYTKALLACRPEGARPGTRLPIISDFISSDFDASDFWPKAKSYRTKALPPSRPVGALPFGRPPAKAGQRAALRLTGLVVDYGCGPFRPPFRAVDCLDLVIQPGRTTGLVGESGSGKSTVAKAIAGLQPFSQGRIEICGRAAKDKNGLTDKQRARLCQLIMQNPLGALNPRLKIRNILLEPLRTHGLTKDLSSRKETDRLLAGLLEEVNLEPGHLYRYAHQLSGGQRQRINIARALALDPQVLICDEIVSALDISVQAQVLNLLLDIQQSRGLAILFIGHDLDVVRHVSDDLVVMHQGRVVESGPAGVVMDRPGSDYTQLLIASARNLGAQEIDRYAPDAA